MPRLKFKHNRVVFFVSIFIVAIFMVIIIPLTSAETTAVVPESTTFTQATAVAKQQSSPTFLSSPNSGDPLEIALNYINEHRREYGLTAADLDDTAVEQSYTRQSDFTQIELRQRHNGIELHNGMILINVAGDGSIINLHSQFMPDLANKINTVRPALTASDAVNSLATHLGLVPQDLTAIDQLGGPSQAVIFNEAGISRNPIPAKLIYQQTGREVRLTWDIEILKLDQKDWWAAKVDAVTGEVISQDNYILHEDFKAQMVDAHGIIPHASAGHPTAKPAVKTSNLLGANDYLIYEWPRESPLHNPQGTAGAPISGRTVQNAPWNSASPFGWHDTNGIAGPEFTVTEGNNVNAYEDGNNPGYQPDCGATLDCSSSPLFDVDLTMNVNTYEAAALSNLFYWNNIIHDMTYLYGFDEVARNFQENNYGNGGAGSDSVNAEAQDTSEKCNARFGTPADGSNPLMQMFLCDNTTPFRDGDFDNGVIAHEYGHGISNRLTGGSSVLCLGNNEQMGEGWSDWLALMMTLEAGDLGSDSRGIGTYLFGQAADGPGIRPNPYSTNFAVNPDTYATITGVSIPHGVGYVWATMLWEMNWELINNGVSHNGLDLDIYNGTGGNNLTTQLVMDGMKLQPCSPGFVDGRNAILLADQNLTGGVNQCVIWDAFARRGLGYSADQGSSSSRSDGTEAFDLPPICQQELKISKSAHPQPALAGSMLTYTLKVTNDVTGTLTNVTITDTITTTQSYVANSADCGGSETGGVVTFPLGTMSSGQSITCTFKVTINNGLGPLTLFTDDFESGLGNWSGDGLWHTENESDSCGAQHAPFSSSSNAAYFGKDDSCNYDLGGTNAATGTLSMNSDIALAADSTPFLYFSHFLQTEVSTNYDKAFVEISTDGGANWLELVELKSANWQLEAIDLGAYAGNNVRIRFRFDSVDYIFNNYFGWLVDDVQIVAEDIIANRACVTAAEGDNACATVEIPTTGPSCFIPPPIVDLAAVKNGAHIDLTWSGTADAYEIHQKVNDFYFVPAAGTYVTTVTAPTTAYSHLNILGDPDNNYAYAVVAKNSCHATAVASPSNHTAEFEFSIVPDSP